ncbi:hypothetical protein RvY_02184 [Ramazzottius varieornatus]|uniref:LRRCT domain-containing protein n=1 Tax=Ramazzottius varieornatus TaxID=947166 RepID=A0A1D1UIX4_RAMVA|nr:hypothetical protein RvY_02184 [Ramazzottius varieornatus]
MEIQWGPNLLILLCLLSIQLVLGQYPLLDFSRPQSNGTLSPSNWTTCPGSLQTLPVSNCSCYLIDEDDLFFQCENVGWNHVQTILYHFEQSGILQEFFLYVRDFVGDMGKFAYTSAMNVTAIPGASQNDTVGLYWSGLYIDGAPEVRTIAELQWAQHLREIVLRNFPSLSAADSNVLPINLQTLVLRETAIREVDINSTLARLSNLTHLEISHSLSSLSIPSFGSDSSMAEPSFSPLHLAGIQTLILRNNSLRDLPADLLAGMSSLHSIDLSHNQLSTLPSSFFHDTFALEEVYLQNNSLSQLTSDSFHTTPYLSILDLSHNALTIPSQLINRHTRRVEIVNMRNNRIDEINEGNFAGWNSVRILNLANNTISSLRRGSFRGLHNLDMLDLSHNSISEVAAGSFEGLSSVHYIDLRSNMMRVIYAGFLEGIRLEYSGLTVDLDVSDNKIRIIEEGAANVSALSENGTHVVLHLNGNSLLCSCRNVWMGRYLSTANTSMLPVELDTGSTAMYCVDSREMMVRDITALTEDNCSVEEPRLFTTALEGIFLAGSILFLLTIVVTLAVLCISLHRRPSSSRTFYPAAYYNPDIYEPSIEIKSISTTTL